MKTKLFTSAIVITLAILLMPHIIYSQWYIQNYATGSVNYSVTRDGKIFLTHNGIIYSSSDQGQTWKTNNVLFKQILSSSFIDSSRGFCYTLKTWPRNSEDNYELFRTTNGGSNWNSVYTNNTYPVTYLYFLNNTTGWGCWGEEGGGYSGRIIKTTNGGLNWTQQYYGRYGIFSIYMFDANRGFATAFDSLLYTTNGGLNWTQRYLSLGLIKIKFIDSLTGFILKSNDNFYKTTNGGINWTSVSIYLPPPGGNHFDIFFVDENIGWLGTSYGNSVGYIYKTTNGGNNWVTQAQNQWGGAKNLLFLNQNTGFAGFDNGKILKTTNSGSNWFIQIERFNDNNTGISFINQNTGFIISSSGIVYKTTNKGGNWNNIYSCGTGLRSVYSDSIAGCFAVGNDGKLISSTDFGNNWVSRNLTIKNLNCIKFRNPTTGYICGDSGKIFRTINGGSNWLLLSTPTTNNLTSISFVNDTKWVCGYKGVVLKSTNNSDEWSAICILPDQTDNNGIYFINEQTGHVINYKYGFPWSYSNIYSTTNGGNTWFINFEYPVYGPPKLISIMFDNQLTGYATAENGDLLISPSGTGTFQVNKNFFSTPFYSSYSANLNSVWLVGSGGLVVSSLNINVGINKLTDIIGGSYYLLQNYPNPFNPVTRIRYALPRAGVVRLAVYDVMGREVEMLVNERQATGSYEAVWDGSRFASGVYFYRLTAEGFGETKRMTLIK
ncbi:MAG: YCF48-related protein [Ignavibacteriae bacterium]|nr:YCF48-related protein [Ignavibacteriota bacterium]